MKIKGFMQKETKTLSRKGKEIVLFPGLFFRVILILKMMLSQVLNHLALSFLTLLS